AHPELVPCLAHCRIGRALALANGAARKVEVGVPVANPPDQRDALLVVAKHDRRAWRPVVQSYSRNPSSAAQRESVSCSSWTCGSSLRFFPHTGQSPAQSVRQRILSGSASATAS